MAKLGSSELRDFLADKDMESLKVCKGCQKNLPLSEYNIRKRIFRQKTYFAFRSECNKCVEVYFDSRRSNNLPPWAEGYEELYDTYIYGMFLIRAIKAPDKKCPKCKEVKNKIDDFGARRRGQYYTCLDYCKPCKLIVDGKERQRNIERVRKAERRRHHKESKGLSSRYVKKQIGRKRRAPRYKKEPLLLPTEAEQRLSCAKWRIDSFISKIDR